MRSFSNVIVAVCSRSRRVESRKAAFEQEEPVNNAHVGTFCAIKPFGEWAYICILYSIFISKDNASVWNLHQRAAILSACVATVWILFTFADMTSLYWFVSQWWKYRFIYVCIIFNNHAVYYMWADIHSLPYVSLLFYSTPPDMAERRKSWIIVASRLTQWYISGLSTSRSGHRSCPNAHITTRKSYSRRWTLWCTLEGLAGFVIFVLQLHCQWLRVHEIQYNKRTECEYTKTEKKNCWFSSHVFVDMSIYSTYYTCMQYYTCVLEVKSRFQDHDRVSARTVRDRAHHAGLRTHKRKATDTDSRRHTNKHRYER